MAKETWEVEPFVRVGPIALGAGLSEVSSVLGEKPDRSFPNSFVVGRTCHFTQRGVSVSVDDQDAVEEIEFSNGASIVPVYRGVKLLGAWKSARTRLAELGFDTPEPDRNNEQTILITDGLTAWSQFEHVAPDSICVTLRTPTPRP